ncbi:protein kinase domain-containing protein [Pseudonocardia sp. CA-107938]|uniref:protein kinase domain-containing protein n=1 Tax=Pseudonocardia sp. CA-107938 TaxID=3240021 RepID=UPI003D8E2892
MVGTEFGPYRLDRMLGRGGMGEVYRAYDTSHQREVAIKLLLESLSADPEYRARFEREARIAAGLREQHIIPIHRYGEIDNRLFIDMRLVDGEDLGSLLAREGALEMRRAVRILGQVAAALDAAHRAGLVHRDVKPANILLAGGGGAFGDSVYLADFGIARESAGRTSARITLTGAAIGTPDYMAPERFTSGVVDHVSDIYSLGCLLYQMLTGRKPFVGDEVLGLLYKHVNEPPPRPSALRSEVPPALDAVVRRSMEKDPAARYRSAGELAAAAEAALAPTPPAPPPVPLHKHRWPRWFYEVDPTPSRPHGNAWPTATDYVRAVQATPRPLAEAGLPGAWLVRDAMGMPATSSGQNAVVFEMGHEGAGLALRCFTRSPQDAAQRYRALAAVLERSDCDAVVPARWAESALQVGDRRWPAVVMPWVPGTPLGAAVEDLLDQPDQLRAMSETWLETVSALASAGLAHGDLQCGNVLVDDAGGMHLVDHDGFFLPGLGPPAELGHPDFQHPRRSAGDWGPGMDGFSILVIHLGLRALAADRDLWRFNSAENLILSREDFVRPDGTPIWARLRGSTDPEVVRLTDLLARVCAAPTPPRTPEILGQLRPAALPPAPPALAPPPVAPGTDRWWSEGTAVQIPDAPAPVRERSGNWMARNTVLAGLTAGLLSAVLVILIQLVLGSAVPPQAAAPVLVLSAGALLTAGLAGVPRATMGAWGSAAKLALGGAALGGALSAVGLGIYTLLTYQTVTDGRADGMLVLAWLVVATSIGVAAGILRGSGRAVVSGVVGGLVGGFVSGLVHLASGPMYVGPGKFVYLEIDVTAPLTVLAIVIACAVMGLAIGIVDRLRRRSWLTVIEGGLRGRELILDRRETHIGTAGSAALRIVGDPGVAPHHAVLVGQDDRYVVICRAAADVNGRRVTSPAPIPLTSGDVLRIGGSFIRFEQRDNT